LRKKRHKQEIMNFWKEPNFAELFLELEEKIYLIFHEVNCISVVFRSSLMASVGAKHIVLRVLRVDNSEGGKGWK